VPTSAANAFSFLLVTVNGKQVTIAPADELGRSFDVRTYSFWCFIRGPCLDRWLLKSSTRRLEGNIAFTVFQWALLV
jgi:hypothetical protein